MATFQSLRRNLINLNEHNHPELNVLVGEEKDVMKELNKFAKEKVEAGKYMAVWGKTEHSDIEDITEKFLTLFEEFAKFHYELIERYDVYRARLKEMKAREDALYALRKRLRDLQEKFKDAIKKQKPQEAIKAELTMVDRDLAEQEGIHEGYKRAILKEAMHLQMDSWMDFGQKITIFATFGKHLSDQIPQGSLAPGQELPTYQGAPVTTKIVSDFLKALRTYDAETKATSSAASNDRRHSHASSFVLDTGNDRRHSHASSFGGVDSEPPQPPRKAYAPHQRASSTDGLRYSPSPEPPPLNDQQLSPTDANQKAQTLKPDGVASAASSPGARRSYYYQAPPPGAFPPPNMYGGPPNGGHMPQQAYGQYDSLPRDPPGGYPTSLPRDTPGGYPTSLPRDNGYPVGYYLPQQDKPLPRAGPDSSSAVTCPVCQRAVIGTKINEHLDSKCAMHLEYDPKQQIQARNEMTDEEIRRKMESFRVG